MKFKNYLYQVPLAATLVLSSGISAARSETILAVTSANTLIAFDSQAPQVIEDSLPLLGLQPGEQLVGIDFRVADNQLFGLGSSGRLYAINSSSGSVTQLGAPIAVTGTSFGFDFNPTADRIRIVSDAEDNLRINPDTAEVVAVDGALAYDTSDPASTMNPAIGAIAYSANSVGQGATTLFAIDTNLNTLVRQGSPNGSPVSPNSGILFTVGSLGLDATALVGFDISEARLGTAIAAITLSGETTSKLYSIDLGGGRATLIGPIGTSAVNGIAVSRAGSLKFSQASYSIQENAGTLEITIERNGGSANPTVSGTPVAATVVVTSSNSTAISGEDYAQVQSTVTFNDGERSKKLQIPIVDDSSIEGNELFTIGMTNTTGGLNIEGSGTSMVSILDNDIGTSSPLRILLTADRTFSESDFGRNGLPVKLFCSDTCSGDITLTISAGNAQRYSLPTTTLASRIFTQNGDRNFRYKLKPSTSIASRLRTRPGATPVTISVTVRDTNGNSTTKSVRTSIR